MPKIGLGVWQVTPDAVAEATVRSAIDRGYRSIDTARAYGNEVGVGRAIKGSGVPRESLFVTTKLWNEDIRQNRVEAAFAESLRDLALDYVDLYLVHWPIKGKVVSAWKALEKIYRTGRAKAIGVSNHLEPQLTELLATADVVPAVDQIEYHPYLQMKSTLAFCRAKGIVPESWSPLMMGRILQDPVLARIGAAHGKSAAQVVLRWNLQTGVVTIPRSTKPDRQTENAAIFDFTLTDAEMAAIAVLDRGQRCGPDPLNFDF